MDILRFSIILLLVIGLVPLASAYNHTHSFTGTLDNSDFFVYGEDVKDTVTTDLTDGNKMEFEWFDPNMVLQRHSTVYRVNSEDDYYYDSIEGKKVVTDGDWTVDVVESEHNIQSTGHFMVAASPEFSYGPFMSMLLAGILYFVMRREVKGHVNVN